MAKRTLDEINTEYSITCGIMGDKIHRMEQLGFEIESHKISLRNLNIEAGNAKKAASIEQPEPGADLGIVGEATT